VTRIRSLVGHCLAWLLILAISAVIAIAVVVPRLGGAEPYVIETGSMRPGMPPGTLVVVRPVATDRLTVGSVITYQLRSGEPQVVTHRIVAQGIDTTGGLRFRTQGDANNTVDAAWVRPVQIKGERWYAVPLLGYLTTLLTGAQRDVVLSVVVTLLLGYAAAMFAGDLRERRRRRREVTS
jgi:signal peptidase